MPVFPIFDQQFLPEKLKRSVKYESVFEWLTLPAVLLLNFLQFFEALRLLKDMTYKAYKVTKEKRFCLISREYFPLRLLWIHIYCLNVHKICVFCHCLLFKIIGATKSNKNT